MVKLIKEDIEDNSFAIEVKTDWEENLAQIKSALEKKFSRVEISNFSERKGSYLTTTIAHFTINCDGISANFEANCQFNYRGMAVMTVYVKSTNATRDFSPYTPYSATNAKNLVSKIDWAFKSDWDFGDEE